MESQQPGQRGAVTSLDTKLPHYTALCPFAEVLIVTRAQLARRQGFHHGREPRNAGMMVFGRDGASQVRG
ncbi:MAG: hypothetical protein VKN33_09700 [Candidatus Sericytochromatia bacterium]|nr:hypothetical protein [Candidatus Sericytochromatia bacterium]